MRGLAPLLWCHMNPVEFYNVLSNSIKALDVDLAETFRRCLPQMASVSVIKETILLAIEPEYLSIAEEIDLWNSLQLTDKEWLERFEVEFKNILYINRFQPDQILMPLAGLQTVSTGELRNGY